MVGGGAPGAPAPASRTTCSSDTPVDPRTRAAMLEPPGAVAALATKRSPVTRADALTSSAVSGRSARNVVMAVGVRVQSSS